MSRAEHTASAWRQYRALVQRFLRRRLADPALVEDLTQETFLRLHRAQLQPGEADRLPGWLLRTAYHLMLDHFRTRRRELPLDEGLAHAADESAAWRAFEPCIGPLAQRLPETYRTALLWDLDGIPQQEIAHLQGIGLSGAKSRVQRARRLLAREFARCCGELPDPDDVLAGCASRSDGKGCA